MCPPFIGMEGRNGMANTVKKEGRDGGHAVKSGWYPSLRVTHVMTHEVGNLPGWEGRP